MKLSKTENKVENKRCKYDIILLLRGERILKLVLCYMISHIKAISFALSIGGIELVTKMMLYVVHERLWNKVNWGKK